MKYWTEGHQIILITEENLSFGNYSQREIKEFKNQMDKGVIPHRLTGISFRYIRDVQFNDRKKRIEIELGKGSIENIEFKNRQLGNTVFNYIKDNFNIFVTTKPSSSGIWKRYIWSMLLIAFTIHMLLTVNQYNRGYTLGGRILGIILQRASNIFDETTILLLGFVLLAWRTITLVLDLKVLKNTYRISRKKINLR